MQEHNIKEHLTQMDTTDYLRQLEQEMMKMTRELHDHVLQEQIIALRELDKLLESPLLGERLDIKKKILTVREQQASSIYILRNFCQGHSTPRLAEGELKRHIEYLLDRLQLRTNIEVRYQNQWSDYGWSGERALHIYRIIQELLHNTEKHATATIIELLLEQNDSMYIVKYYDNGVGVNLKNELHITALGLKNIYSRAECLYADINIETAIDAGFQCVLYIPNINNKNNS